MAKTSQKQLDAIKRLHKENTVTVLLRLHKDSDRVIIDRLNSVENKVGYVRDLIMQDIEKDAR